MRLPSIHLNGSDAQSLFDGYYAALKAVQAASKALAACGPHGRDYYVQDGAATGEAIAEHVARMDALETVERDLTVLALHVMDNSNGKVRS